MHLSTALGFTFVDAHTAIIRANACMEKKKMATEEIILHTHTCKSLICHTDGNISLHVSAQLDLFLPPANEVCEGYVFTCVCQSF